MELLSKYVDKKCLLNTHMKIQMLGFFMYYIQLLSSIVYEENYNQLNVGNWRTWFPIP